MMLLETNVATRRLVIRTLEYKTDLTRIKVWRIDLACYSNGFAVVNR